MVNYCTQIYVLSEMSNVYTWRGIVSDCGSSDVLACALDTDMNKNEFTSSWNGIDFIRYE